MKIILFAVGVFFAAPTFAQSFDFKGLPLGATIADIEATTEYRCQAPQGKGTCSLPYNKSETLAGMPVEYSAMNIRGGLLASVSVSFNSRGFERASAALTEKYGTPKTTSATPLKTQAGVEYENIITRWENETSEVEIRKYMGRVTRSSLRISTKSFLEGLKREGADDAKKDAKDL